MAATTNWVSNVLSLTYGEANLCSKGPVRRAGGVNLNIETGKNAVVASWKIGYNNHQGKHCAYRGPGRSGCSWVLFAIRET